MRAQGPSNREGDFSETSVLWRVLRGQVICAVSVARAADLARVQGEAAGWRGELLSFLVGVIWVQAKRV